MAIEQVFKVMEEDFSDEWLLVIELFELAILTDNSDLLAWSKAQLGSISKNRPAIAHLIKDGMDLSLR